MDELCSWRFGIIELALGFEDGSRASVAHPIMIVTPTQALVVMDSSSADAVRLAALGLAPSGRGTGGTNLTNLGFRTIVTVS
jgi:hypothetical protein